MQVAVVIPTYNSGALLDRTLESVSHQERQPDEVLIVDDGSTDGTPERSADWASRQPFAVRLLKNQLKHHPLGGPGPAAARQTALQVTGADLIALLDHDDLLLPDHLRTFSSAFDAIPELVFCFADALEFVDENDVGYSFMAGKAIDNVTSTGGVLPGLRVPQSGMLEALIMGSFVPTAANMFRRDAALRVGGFDPVAGSADDALMWLRLVKFGPTAYFTQPLARRRSHGFNLSRTQGGLRTSWNAYDAIRLLIDEEQYVTVTDGERRFAMERMREISEELFYHSSLEGLRALRTVVSRLGQSGIPGAKHALRALRSEFRRFASSPSA